MSRARLAQDTFLPNLSRTLAALASLALGCSGTMSERPSDEGSEGGAGGEPGEHGEGGAEVPGEAGAGGQAGETGAGGAAVGGGAGHSGEGTGGAGGENTGGGSTGAGGENTASTGGTQATGGTGGAGGTPAMSGGPPGKVPVFVAAGNGGRTVVSCDDGRSWIAQEVIANTDDDHHPWTHKGLAYGDGVFLQLGGWGHSPPNLKRSTDGVTWQRIVMPNGFSNTPGGIGFSAGVFVAMESFNSRVSRDGGRTWTAGGGTGHGYHIRGAGGGGMAVGGSGSDRKPAVSWNQGRTFTVMNACPNMDFGNLGQHGGLAWGNDALVMVSASGGFCKLTSGSVTRSGTVGGSNLRGKVVWVGDRFLFPSGTRAYVSADGETWSSVAFRPANVNINIVARGASGTYVGITQAATGFYRSEDGVNWQVISGPSGPRLVDLVFGWADPSDRCPLR